MRAFQAESGAADVAEAKKKKRQEILDTKTLNIWQKKDLLDQLDEEYARLIPAKQQAAAAKPNVNLGRPFKPTYVPAAGQTAPGGSEARLFAGLPGQKKADEPQKKAVVRNPFTYLNHLPSQQSTGEANIGNPQSFGGDGNGQWSTPGPSKPPEPVFPSSVDLPDEEPAPQTRPDATRNPSTKVNAGKPDSKAVTANGADDPAKKAEAAPAEDNRTWWDKLVAGDGVGALTGFLGTAISAPQSLYLNGIYNAAALANGKPMKFTYNMDGRKYTDEVAKLYGEDRGIISEAYAVNPWLGLGVDIAYNTLSDPLTLVDGVKPNGTLKAVPGDKIVPGAFDDLSEIYNQDVRHATVLDPNQPAKSAAQSIINKIDPDFFNSKSRFGEGFYVTQKGETAVAELAAHDQAARDMIRFGMDVTGQKGLDLADPLIARRWGFTKDADDVACRAIATKARELGYNIIAFPSYRGDGVNYVVYSDFDNVLHPQMVSPARD